jgi:hypothetical protein
LTAAHQARLLLNAQASGNDVAALEFLQPKGVPLETLLLPLSKDSTEAKSQVLPASLLCIFL